MTDTIIVYPRTEPCRAWLYTGQAKTEWPLWVQARCVLLDGDMLLERSSGRQLVNSYEWLIADLDGDIYSLPNDEFTVAFRRSNEQC
jgi:hypothetical protein